jgi:glucarate dehydratase
LSFWFYSGDLGVATATHLHLAAALPHLDRASQSLLRWTTDDVISSGPFVARDGAVRVPAGPGLGVELDERALHRCADRFAREGPYEYYSGPPLPRH